MEKKDNAISERRSIWEKSISLSSFPALTHDLKTDVLIIGGGMAGLLCTFMLCREGIDCALVESNTICSGTTAGTTAKLTSLHGLIYHKLIRRFGVERARMYYDANQSAIESYKRASDGLDVGFEEKDAFVYSLDAPEKLEQEMRALRQLNISAELVERVPLPFTTFGAVRFPNQAQFNPLKFAAAISCGMPIYERTPVRELGRHFAVTDHGRISAKSIIIATHFPILNKHGSYFMKLYQSRSYVLALKNAPQFDGMYVDESGFGFSFRNFGNLLLFGNGGHRTGKKCGGWGPLEAFARKHWRGSEVEARWAAQDCMSLDDVPYIGPYSRRARGLYVATGFNKWGMTSSMVAAKLLTDGVCGRYNALEQLFTPSRSVLHPQLLVNMCEAVKDVLTPAKKRCPHMGCALKWNPNEHTWDCPCHGSRFTKTGNLINGPATGGLKP